MNLYGLTVGQTAEAELNFSANPSPLDVKWGYAENFADIFPTLNASSFPTGKEGNFTTEWTYNVRKYTLNNYNSLLRFAVCVTKLNFIAVH